MKGNLSRDVVCAVALTVAFTIARGQSPAVDCRHLASCRDCISTQVCGWCSGPLRFLNGTWSDTRCARDVDYGNELLCFDVFSTEQCVRGYRCDASKGRCIDAGDGEGTSYSDCAATCNCTTPGCDRFICVGAPNDMFSCVHDPNGGDVTLSECRDSCGVSAATPIPRGNCTPPCTVPCDPHASTCCPNSNCGFDFVWNDYRCHPDGEICAAVRENR